MANPERPAAKREQIDKSTIEQATTRGQGQGIALRTRTDAPFCLKRRDAGHTCHSEEVEEYLRGVEDDGGF